ncbi:hypothetical protein C2S51_007253 [Perilla frutescens var. frutescens]|nr:hypothetical protein C2S51_007253 [Perilla frutescens var. frutescens]
MSTVSSHVSNQSSDLPSVVTPPSPIQINAATHLPIRLTTANYFSWKLQFTSLFIGLNLIGFLNGSSPAPPSTKTHVIPLIVSATTSAEVWSCLDRIFSKRFPSYIIHLKDKLLSLQRRTSPISNFWLQIKTIIDELSTLSSPPFDVDVLIYCTCGLGHAYKDVVAALRTSVRCALLPTAPRLALYRCPVQHPACYRFPPLHSHHSEPLSVILIVITLVPPCVGGIEPRRNTKEDHQLVASSSVP